MIYVIHSTKIDYQTLYKALREDEKNMGKRMFILPHETENYIFSKDIIKTCDKVLVIGDEYTFGMGVELGWADSFNKQILVISTTDNLPKSLQILRPTMVVK